MIPVTLFVLVLLAALSPLLTFTRLFQLKEWRFDRLREHLRHEGWLRQLFGWVRPTVVIGAVCSFFVVRFLFTPPGLVPEVALWVGLGLLAWFTLFRLVIGRQAKPVWTMKAVAVVALSLILFAALDGFFAFAFGRQSALVLIFLPLFPFVSVAFSLLVLTPLDHFLRRQVFWRARRRRAQCQALAVIGVTGSVGKTTTKELLAHILSGGKKVLVTPAHVNTELGVAALILKELKAEHEIFIVEMGAYRKGEIALLCSIAAPQIGVITFIGTQHLALFGSQGELMEAKGELFAALPPEGRAFLNADGVTAAQAAFLQSRASCPVHTAGTGGHAEYEAFDVQEGPGGVSFTLRGVPYLVPLWGTHQVSNILLAVACAEKLGVSLKESSERLRSFPSIRQTFERKEGGKGQVILDDTHNASPESFRAAIEWARLHPAKTKILVTSGLLELGKAECGMHRELGLLSRGVFQEVLFLNSACVRHFEQGFGKQVKVLRRRLWDRDRYRSFKIAMDGGTLVVCEGRMHDSFVQGLLS